MGISEDMIDREVYFQRESDGARNSNTNSAAGPDISNSVRPIDFERPHHTKTTLRENRIPTSTPPRFIKSNLEGEYRYA